MSVFSVFLVIQCMPVYSVYSWSFSVYLVLQCMFSSEYLVLQCVWFFSACLALQCIFLFFSVYLVLQCMSGYSIYVWLFSACLVFHCMSVFSVYNLFFSVCVVLRCIFVAVVCEETGIWKKKKEKKGFFFSLSLSPSPPLHPISSPPFPSFLLSSFLRSLLPTLPLPHSTPPRSPFLPPLPLNIFWDSYYSSQQG